MRLVYLFILGVVALLYLLLREWVDRKKEKALEMEVVREAEGHLGSWASKTKEALITLRLRRTGEFSYKFLQYPGLDTIKTMGSYDIIGAGEGRSTDYYPRLVAVNEKNDTLFNFFIAYITPYDSKTEKVDRMILNPNSIYDTVSYTFYRIKP